LSRCVSVWAAPIAWSIGAAAAASRKAAAAGTDSTTCRAAIVRYGAMQPLRGGVI